MENAISTAEAISNNYSIKLHTSSSSDILFHFKLNNLAPTGDYGDESTLKLSEKLPDIINSSVNSANINLTDSSAGKGNGEVINKPLTFLLPFTKMSSAF